MDMTSGLALGVILAFLAAVIVYPGQAMIAAGAIMIVAAGFTAMASKTVFQEISASLGLVGGLIAFGLGLAIVQLTAIRKALEARPPAAGPSISLAVDPAPALPVRTAVEPLASSRRRFDEDSRLR